MQTGAADGTLGHAGFSPISRPMPRGQWERRLQTDIHMAKKALSEALSPNNNTFTLLPESNSNLSSESSFCSTKQTQSSPCYASSADNIARLLKGWMKKSPKGSCSKTLNDTDSTSEGYSIVAKGSNNSVELNETFESLFGYNESLDSSNSESPEATLFQDESKPAGVGAEMPFSLLEQWLLDDGGYQEKLSLLQ